MASILIKKPLLIREMTKPQHLNSSDNFLVDRIGTTIFYIKSYCLSFYNKLSALHTT